MAITCQLGKQPRIDSATGSINERSGSKCIFDLFTQGLGCDSGIPYRNIFTHLRHERFSLTEKENR